MRISINKSRIVSLVVFLPFMEGLFGFLEYYTNEAQFRSITVIQVFMVIYFCIIEKKFFTYLIRNYKTECMLLIYMVLSLLWTNIKSSTWSTFLWIFMPILWALSLVYYCNRKRLYKKKLLSYIIDNYVIYCVFVVLVNLVKYGLFFFNGERLHTPGGGAVIFGYTTAIILAILLSYRDLYTERKRNIYVFILFFTIVCSGSRGAIWPALLIILAYFLFSNIKSAKGIITIFVVLIMLFILLLIDAGNLFSTLLPRIFDSHDYSRSVSFMGVSGVFINESVLEKIIGQGLGNVFVYQKWLIDVANGVQNELEKFFLYKNQIMLVQPHNTFFYFLLEMGLISVVFLLLILLKYFAIGVKEKKWMSCMTILCIIFVNCFDSILVVQPGIAGLIWFLVFTMFSDLGESRHLNKK